MHGTQFAKRHDGMHLKCPRVQHVILSRCYTHSTSSQDIPHKFHWWKKGAKIAYKWVKKKNGKPRKRVCLSTTLRRVTWHLLLLLYIRTHEQMVVETLVGSLVCCFGDIIANTVAFIVIVQITVIIVIAIVVAKRNCCCILHLYIS